MIEYLYKSDETGYYPLKVRMEGKICGEIRKIKGGFAYFPKGSDGHGEVFETIDQVQKSLSE